MDDSLYTNGCAPIESDELIPPAIKDAINLLRTAYPEIQIHNWDKRYIAIALSVRVCLPFEDPVNDVDIREEEPIILLLHRTYYPQYGTRVRSNRRDFPRDQLPHLYLTAASKPVSFCLHPDNLDDWMVERTILDLVVRVRMWLFDAATDALITSGNTWDPIRIERSCGDSVYPAGEIQRLVQKQWKRSHGGEGFSLLRYKLFPHSSADPLADDASYTIKWIKMVSEQDASRTVKEIGKLNEQYNPFSPTERHLLGILVYAATDPACKTYFADIPKTLPHLVQWGADLGLPIDQALKLFQRKDYQLFPGIPIILAIPRPINLTGVESNIELLNLVIRSDSEPLITDEAWNGNAMVDPLLNFSPLDTSKAQEISGTKALGNPHMLIVGCGALGSKLVMHMARAGLTNMTLVDHDSLWPHNLVRHSLLANSLAKNKADALREEVARMYPGQRKARSEQCNGRDIFHGNKEHLLKEKAWFVDATASKAFQQTVVHSDFPGKIRVMRAELVHEGQIGIMSIEGRDRNPRLDDIEAHLLTLAYENDYLSHWLKEESLAAESELQSEGIAVGMGCHTFTMEMADDVISSHAALISIGFQRQIQEASNAGCLQVSYLDHDGNMSSQRIPVPKFRKLQADNDATWEIRIADPVIKAIQIAAEESGVNETGGILIGKVNQAHKVVHVTKVLPPSSDSQSTTDMFVRGANEALPSVKNIQSRTGGYIDYVGEWHSHPIGSGQMSCQDTATGRQLQAVVKPSGKPVHIMIAAPTGLHSHVYSGDSTI